MSELTRRHFLATVPAAGMGAAATFSATSRTRHASSQTTSLAPLWSIGRPVYATRKRDPNNPNDPGGLVLKISGLAFARVKKDGSGARIYFLDAVKAGQQRHFAQLLIHKAGLAPGSSEPDAMTRDLAVYELRDQVTINGEPETLKLTMGSLVTSCDDHNAPGLPPGLNSFLQPRATLDWKEADYPSAPDHELEKRSLAWVDLHRGRFEDPADVAVDDPADVSMLVTDANGKSQVVRQVLYFGLPELKNVTFTIGKSNPKTVTVDSTNNQIIAGLVHMPVHEHMDTTMPSEMKDFAMLLHVVHPSKPVPKVAYAKKCDVGRTPECLCCPVPLEMV